MRIRYRQCGFEAFLDRREIRRVIRIAFQKEKRVGSGIRRGHGRETPMRISGRSRDAR
jgi:hypothetical protein